MISEVRAGIEPQVENLAQASGAEINLTSFVHEPNNGDVLLAERLEKPFRHFADGVERARPSIASAGKIVYCDGHLPVRPDGAEGDSE